MADMKWLEAIEKQAFESTDPEAIAHAPSDCVELIGAVRLAEKGVEGHESFLMSRIAHEHFDDLLARLRSGEFVEGK